MVVIRTSSGIQDHFFRFFCFIRSQRFLISQMMISYIYRSLNVKDNLSSSTAFFQKGVSLGDFFQLEHLAVQRFLA